MKNAKFYIGPMSKNVVDSVREFTEETGNNIGFVTRNVSWFNHPCSFRKSCGIGGSAYDRFPGG